MDDPHSFAPTAPQEIRPVAIEQLGHTRTSSSQQTPSFPAGATFNNSLNSGDKITNAIGDIKLNHYNNKIVAPPPAPLPSIIDAPINRISSCFTGRQQELASITSAVESFRSDKPTRVVIHGMPGLGKS